jgi:hypothetical protein
MSPWNPSSPLRYLTTDYAFSRSSLLVHLAVSCRLLRICFHSSPPSGRSHSCTWKMEEMWIWCSRTSNKKILPLSKAYRIINVAGVYAIGRHRCRECRWFGWRGQKTSDSTEVFYSKTFWSHDMIAIEWVVSSLPRIRELTTTMQLRCITLL